MLQFVDRGSEERDLRTHALMAVVQLVVRHEIIDHEIDELTAARVGIPVDLRQLQVLLVYSFLEAEGVHHLGKDLLPDVRRPSVIVAGDHPRACLFQTPCQLIHREAEARLAGILDCSDVTRQVPPKGVVRLVNVDAQLFQPAQLLEPLIGGQVTLVFWLIEPV